MISRAEGKVNDHLMVYSFLFARLGIERRPRGASPGLLTEEHFGVGPPTALHAPLWRAAVRGRREKTRRRL